MHDRNLLLLIEEDIAPAQQLLALLQQESVALHGRDMPLLENILAQKQSLIVLLEQHGRKRTEILLTLKLPADHSGLEILAQHSQLGPDLLARGDLLTGLLADCRAVNEQNGKLIHLQQLTTANQMRILMGGEPPSLYDARGSTSKLAKPRPLSQA
ncbi:MULTISPECIES: flagella synthesis protein FlgN [Pseudomonas]|uniref:Flagellar protein FlgN n=1 Tax=Pseudomonas eucalypticola TaxID=2599595 RepID=A0A7D5H492_9PSED|nr:MULTISPECIES: flagellar protein FlgN [Pseudomonas]QKZ03589.1 flagellar protein FlgN [Pseudomonas eucalypticola]